MHAPWCQHACQVVACVRTMLAHFRVRCCARVHAQGAHDGRMSHFVVPRVEPICEMTGHVPIVLATSILALVRVPDLVRFLHAGGGP